MNTGTQTIVIGGGQAGLAVGYYLAAHGLPFQILDAYGRTGDAWRKRWDSLRLFSPARYAGLPGLPFPARGDVFPTKNQVADYLEEYRRRFQLPVRHNTRVERLWREKERFAIAAGREQFAADNVVVAMANYQAPRIPDFARELDPQIVQLHSQEYRNAAQLRDGGVLVVGAGNSGAEIALEAAGSHPTWLAGKETGQIPWPIDSFVGRHLVTRLTRIVFHHLLTLDTPVGRKVRPQVLHRATPLIRTTHKDLAKVGVARVPRVARVEYGLPVLASGRAMNVKNVIWCTGYQRGFPWIDLDIFDNQGDPRQERGVVHSTPGLYFVGLHFQYAMSSGTLFGVARDAERVVQAIASRPVRAVTKSDQLQVVNG